MYGIAIYSAIGRILKGKHQIIIRIYLTTVFHPTQQHGPTASYS